MASIQRPEWNILASFCKIIRSVLFLLSFPKVHFRTTTIFLDEVDACRLKCSSLAPTAGRALRLTMMNPRWRSFAPVWEKNSSNGECERKTLIAQRRPQETRIRRSKKFTSWKLNGISPNSKRTLLRSKRRELRQIAQVYPEAVEKMRKMVGGVGTA